MDQFKKGGDAEPCEGYHGQCLLVRRWYI